jgi:ABC-type glycerol-3-phosphate transport system substrate-binding protein
MIWMAVLVVALVGCSPIRDSSLAATQAASLTAAVQSTQAASVSTPGAQATPTTPADQSALTVWLPPQFHLSRDSEASRLLQVRIDSFAGARPGLQIEVRAKAESGEGGMLKALAAAHSAAPGALPDLVLLPRALLESAAIKGYVRELDGVMEEADWFNYAREMGRVQNSVFGIPFAGDLMIMVYNERISNSLPRTWQETLQITHTLGFAAGDPQALFTVALYQSAGGSLRDEQGLPMLDEDILTRVLSVYAQANQTGQMPFWLMQYTNDSQALDLYRNGQADLLITWRSTLERGLGNPAASNFSALPTEDGSIYALASGYVWVFAGQSPERRSQALELAQFLSNPELLAEWNLLSGYLPPRMQALDDWPDSAGREMIATLSLNAHPVPSTDLLEIIGPLLKQAAQQVLLQQTDPYSAAKLAADSLKRP